MRFLALALFAFLMLANATQAFSCGGGKDGHGDEMTAEGPGH